MFNDNQKFSLNSIVIFLFFIIPAFWFLAISNSDQANTQPKEQQENIVENKEDQRSSTDNQNEQKNTSEFVWGVDSASYTNKDLLMCVKENFGTPSVWGRYLGDREDVSAGLDKTEIELLHENKIKILLIYNHFNDATGYENGQNQAKRAVELAKKLGVPEGAAIFADIEPNYPVNYEFIIGWTESISDSKYKPGVYGNFSDEHDLNKSYAKALKESKLVRESVVVWSSYPHEGVTSKDKAPIFEGKAPKGSLLYGWQYGIEAKTCNIDTNLFKEEMLKYLW